MQHTAPMLQGPRVKILITLICPKLCDLTIQATCSRMTLDLCRFWWMCLAAVMVPLERIHRPGLAV